MIQMVTMWVAMGIACGGPSEVEMPADPPVPPKFSVQNAVPQDADATGALTPDGLEAVVEPPLPQGSGTTGGNETADGTAPKPGTKDASAPPTDGAGAEPDADATPTDAAPAGD